MKPTGWTRLVGAAALSFGLTGAALAQNAR